MNKDYTTSTELKHFFANGMTPDEEDFSKLIDYVESVSNGQEIKFLKGNFPIKLTEARVQKFIITDIEINTKTKNMVLFESDSSTPLIVTGHLNLLEQGQALEGEKIDIQWLPLEGEIINLTVIEMHAIEANSQGLKLVDSIVDSSILEKAYHQTLYLEFRR